jgi:UDP-N-acetylmuramate--alanine ligase
MNMLIVDKVYFVGIGGIGMSALARYFNAQGKQVGGYDKTETPLTKALEQEGIEVHYKDNQIPAWMLEAHHEKSLVVYTPAVPENNQELQHFRQHRFHVRKRSEVLGFITQDAFTIAVAGTHGKTTTATILAHVLRSCGVDCTAFLGGVSSNYNTNLLLSKKGNIVVVEADEYDRSFLKLTPDIAVITSVEADHMDVYQDEEDIKKTFLAFAHKVKQRGILLVNKHIDMDFEVPEKGTLLTYSADIKADFMAHNLRIENGKQVFDAQMLDILPGEVFERGAESIQLKLPGKHNVDNALAAMAVACQLGAQCDDIVREIASFDGVKRRYERHVEGDFVYIDDYAHHPEEVRATLSATQSLYPNDEITVVFQPHLFSRTRDFSDEFAEALSLANEVILLDIYPAREQPIEGVSSEMLLKKVTATSKAHLSKEALLEELSKNKRSVLLTLGAGDIDQLVEPIKNSYA